MRNRGAEKQRQKRKLLNTKAQRHKDAEKMGQAKSLSHSDLFEDAANSLLVPISEDIFITFSHRNYAAYHYALAMICAYHRSISIAWEHKIMSKDRDDFLGFDRLWLSLSVVCAYLHFFLNQHIAYSIVRQMNFDMYPPDANAQFFLNLLMSLFYALELALAQSFVVSQYFQGRAAFWGLITFASAFVAAQIAPWLYPVGNALGEMFFQSDTINFFHEPFVQLTGIAFALFGFRIVIFSLQSILFQAQNRLRWLGANFIAYGLFVLYLYAIGLMAASRNPVYYPVDIGFLIMFFVGGGIVLGFAARWEARTLYRIMSTEQRHPEKSRSQSLA